MTQSGLEEKSERVVSQDTIGSDLFQKNLNASRPSEHPPVKGGGYVKTFRWDHIGCKDKTSSWHLIGFPVGSNIGSAV